MHTKTRRIPSAFISHKSCDAPFAQRLATALRGHGVFAWLDIWNMAPGKALSDAMQHGIEHCEVMILVLTPEAVKSVHAGTGGVAFEVHIGEGRKYSDADFRIIGILLRNCRPPEKLRNRIGRWIDFRDHHLFQQRVDELAQWIRDPESDLGPPVVIDSRTVHNLSEEDRRDFNRLLQLLDPRRDLRSSTDIAVKEFTKRLLFQTITGDFSLNYARYRAFLVWARTKGYRVPKRLTFETESLYQTALDKVERLNRVQIGCEEVDPGLLFSKKRPFRTEM
ncbi:MAG: toll/interleukin-1 receptor domain-containing protein [Sedimentisphaerales bacterium]|nr:toll/interleukin-1 receptor domain-containing protein [Sedimentisphaerales bacterium]